MKKSKSCHYCALIVLLFLYIVACLSSKMRLPILCSTSSIVSLAWLSEISEEVANPIGSSWIPLTSASSAGPVAAVLPFAIQWQRLRDRWTVINRRLWEIGRGEGDSHHQFGSNLFFRRSSILSETGMRWRNENQLYTLSRKTSVQCMRRIVVSCGIPNFLSTNVISNGGLQKPKSNNLSVCCETIMVTRIFITDETYLPTINTFLLRIWHFFQPTYRLSTRWKQQPS